MQDLEITRMLTISLSHISKETADLIKEECETWKNPEIPACFKKGDFGYIIHVPEDFLVGGEEGIEESYPDVPDDLHNCMLLAYENDCNWLCLDCDAMNVNELTVFNW